MWSGHISLRAECTWSNGLLCFLKSGQLLSRGGPKIRDADSNVFSKKNRTDDTVKSVTLRLGKEAYSTGKTSGASYISHILWYRYRGGQNNAKSCESCTFLCQCWFGPPFACNTVSILLKIELYKFWTVFNGILCHLLEEHHPVIKVLFIHQLMHQ